MANPRIETLDLRTGQQGAFLELGLLGPLTVRKAGTEIEVTGPKRRALLILLALNAGKRVGRERVIDALWPDRPSGREESTLRVHISHLRDVLEPDRGTDPSVLLTRGSAYMLAAEMIDLDITLFDQLIEEARPMIGTQPDSALLLLNEALELWRGRPLHDVEYEEFAQPEIRRLELARIGAVVDTAEALVELGHNLEAIDRLEPLVKATPSRERPVRLLMLALYRGGRHADALRVARRHERHLSEQGLEPSPQLRLLEERILQHDPTLLPEGSVDWRDLSVGHSVRGYELRERIGEGVVGVVYRAFQPSMARRVAVKIIRPHLAEAPEFVRRFNQDAQVIAALEHPHIVPVYDFWREPTGAFLVIRWMEGGSLSDRLDKPWEMRLVSRVFTQIADALTFAHTEGLVHRDMKPNNILFDSSGNAYLSDFSLAVTGIETGSDSAGPGVTIERPYWAPEVIRGEPPTIASDVYSLGVLLAEAASGSEFGSDGPAELPEEVREVVLVATAPSPADRFPDVAAFQSALQAAIGPVRTRVPRTVRRNPYKGLAPFEESDRADFYGRDDLVEEIVDMVATSGLTVVIGASGSGKSSVVKAGLIPELRDGVLPGSEDWSVVPMVPGIDPFEEFHVSLRAAAVGYETNPAPHRSRVLRDAFHSALDGPNARALLIIDQFEELYSSEIDEQTRARFLDNLVDLASDAAHRIRVVLALRADFSDRPLAHPRLGDLISKTSVMVAPMKPELIEDVIRRPAARVGIDVEPGLTAEIVRDVAAAPGYLPLLQYVLTELFERRTEDRLSVHTYRSLGGIEGVLERQAEAAYKALTPAGRLACRQMFLRMVHLGRNGEETRRRLPLDELRGLGGPETGEALESFAATRLVTYDRDPVSRTPTVEVAHETVISRWARYRIWIDEARADLLAHRRLATAEAAWTESGEDPSYLMTGGPLSSALEVVESDHVTLNEDESRFVAESRRADEKARAIEDQRRRVEADLKHQARRRLLAGIGTAILAVAIGVLAVFAFLQSKRADDLAATQQRQSTARALAAASIANLGSEDPNRALQLAIEAADLSLNAGEELLPEVVDALHRAIINPRPNLIIEGARGALGGRAVEYSSDGSALVVLAEDGGALVLNPTTGVEKARIGPIEPQAFGVEFHPNGSDILTIHSDTVRRWDWESEMILREYDPPNDVSITSAVLSDDGSSLAIGGDDGVARVYITISGRLVAELDGHPGDVSAMDFDGTGNRLATAGDDGSVLFWNLMTGESIQARKPVLSTPVRHLDWQPAGDRVVATFEHGEILAWDALTGERFASFGNGDNPGYGVTFDPTGGLILSAGADGQALVFGTYIGGEPALSLPTGGVPLRDAEFNPAEIPANEIATVGVDGQLRIWRDLWGSELPARFTLFRGPEIAGTPDGSRYALAGSQFHIGSPEDLRPFVTVSDVSTGETLLKRDAFSGEGEPALAISADGSTVAWAGVNGEIEVATIDTADTITISSSGVSNLRLALSHDGSVLAWTGLDGQIRIWDLNSVEQRGLLMGHGDREPENIGDPVPPARVEEIQFRPDSTELASVGYDGTVRLWQTDVLTGQVVDSLDFAVTSIAFTTDGSRMTVGDRTGSLRSYDVDSLTRLPPLDGVSGPLYDLVYSPDGHLLVGAGPGPRVHIWNSETGKIVHRLRGSVFWPTSTVFTDDGSALLAMSTEGVIRRYLLDPVDLVELARRELANVK